MKVTLSSSIERPSGPPASMQIVFDSDDPDAPTADEIRRMAELVREFVTVCTTHSRLRPLAAAERAKAARVRAERMRSQAAVRAGSRAGGASR